MILILATLAFSADRDPSREKTLWAKVYCGCGCGEVLAECSHVECKRKSALKQEIGAAIRDNKSDEAILDAMAAKYGSTILVVPAFRGFNTLLWIVPVGVAVLGLGGLILSRRRERSAKPPTPR
jgi:cytochrome c-type biogenesis protein CcmH